MQLLLAIGHSNHRPELVRDYLKQRGVTHLVDVRSKPYSRFNGGFNQDRFHATLADVGIEYLWWGQDLGGFAVPDERMATAIDRMARYFAKRPGSLPAMMCSEGKACECHRHHWITRYLLKNTEVRVINIHPTKPDEDPHDVPFEDGFNPTGKGLPWPIVRPARIVPAPGIPPYISCVGYPDRGAAERELNRACPGLEDEVVIRDVR